MERLAADISRLLALNNLHRDAILIDGCYGWKNCKSAYCVKCMSRRTLNERRHLEQTLPALLATDPTLQLWFVTSAAEDSADIRTTAKAAVQGVRQLLRHPRLKNRVVGSFSVLEIAHKTSRVDPCSHVHSLIVTKPMDKGRNRISEAEWVRLWEQCCPRARARDPTVRLLRQNSKRPKSNLSIVVKHVPRDGPDITKVIRYCSKWSYVANIVRNYRTLLIHPNNFIHRIQALTGVTRFFGSLHLQRY
jgi:plasmid rolling circle replication initiator protein Rep